MVNNCKCCIMCVDVLPVFTAPGFNAAIAGNVTTTSLVVGNAVGTPNATTLGTTTLGK